MADRVKQSDQFVFYEIDGNSGMFMKGDVQGVGSITVEKKVGLLNILDRKKRITMKRLGMSLKWSRLLDSRLFLLALLMIAAVAIDQLPPRLWRLVRRALQKGKMRTLDNLPK